MCSKKSTKIIRNRRKNKQNIFTEILSGSDNGLVKVSFKKFTLKKFSNNIFMHLQREFINALPLDWKKIKDKNDIISKHTELNNCIGSWV